MLFTKQLVVSAFMSRASQKCVRTYIALSYAERIQALQPYKSYTLPSYECIATAIRGTVAIVGNINERLQNFIFK